MARAGLAFSGPLRSKNAAFSFATLSLRHPQQVKFVLKFPFFTTFLACIFRAQG